MSNLSVHSIATIENLLSFRLYDELRLTASREFQESQNSIDIVHWTAIKLDDIFNVFVELDCIRWHKNKFN